MNNYNADNMTQLLGSESTNEDAERLGRCLEAQGWTLYMGADAPVSEWTESDSLSCDQYRAFRQENGEWREITESEWQDALSVVFP